MSKPKICLVIAGGTIGMSVDKNSGSLAPSKTNNEILQHIPELSQIAEIETVFVTDIDSTNMTPEVWNDIAQAIYSRMNEFDGFVVTHGTDTMSYTASAISFMIQDLPKPIIFTGSQLSLNDTLRPEAKSNLIFAFEYATRDIAEVAIFFGSKLLRANRSHKVSQFDFDAFESSNFPLLGKAGIRPHLNPFRTLRSNTSPKYYKLLPKKVALIKYFAQLEPEIISYYINQKYSGIIIEGAGPGNLPTHKDFAGEIAKATKQNIPVVIESQCEVGSVELEMYEVGKQLVTAGAISAQDMTYEATYTKLLWALSMTSDLSEVRDLMTRNIVGELSEESTK